MSEELKSCPFCGGEVEIKNWADGNQWSAECSECGVGESYNDTREDAVIFWNTRHIPEGHVLINLDSVLVPRGEPMPQTVEAWQYLGHQYEKELLANRDEIAALKAKVNDLTQKFGARNDLVKESARLKQEGEKLREDYDFFMTAFIEENRRLKDRLEKLGDKDCFALVPVEPTDAMLDALYDAGFYAYDEGLIAAWKAMIAAAQEADQ